MVFGSIPIPSHLQPPLLCSSSWLGLLFANRLLNIRGRLLVNCRPWKLCNTLLTFLSLGRSWWWKQLPGGPGTFWGPSVSGAARLLRKELPEGEWQPPVAKVSGILEKGLRSDTSAGWSCDLHGATGVPSLPLPLSCSGHYFLTFPTFFCNLLNFFEKKILLYFSEQF